MTSKSLPPSIALAHTLPSVYVNNVQLSCTNGMFRVTFLEHGILGDAEPPLLAPRASVTMTRETAADLARVLLGFIAQVDAQLAAVAEANATMGSMQ